jgi:hypothetical protein
VNIIDLGKIRTTRPPTGINDNSRYYSSSGQISSGRHLNRQLGIQIQVFSLSPLAANMSLRGCESTNPAQRISNLQWWQMPHHQHEFNTSSDKLLVVTLLQALLILDSSKLKNACKAAQYLNLAYISVQSCFTDPSATGRVLAPSPDLTSMRSCTNASATYTNLGLPPPAQYDNMCRFGRSTRPPDRWENLNSAGFGDRRAVL